MSLRELGASVSIGGGDSDVYSVYRLAVYVVSGLAIVFFGFPIYWMFVSSVKPIQNITTYPPTFFPRHFTFQNYVQLFTNTGYTTWLTNSIIISIGIVVLTTVLSTLAGYALTRYRIPFKKWIAAMFIFGYMFPPITLGIPYFMIFLRLHLVNSLLAVVIAATSITLPFSTWLMWQFFQTVPISLEEAAWTNGASRFRGIFEVALPSALPGIIAVAIYAFAIGWNSFLFPFLFLETPGKKVLTTGLYSFLQGTQTYWGSLMAASAALTIPPLLLVLFLNRYIMEGFAIRSQ